MKKIITLFLAFLIILATLLISLISCQTFYDPSEKTTAETNDTTTKKEKTISKIGFLQYDENNHKITWAKNEDAEYYRIEITKRQLNEQGKLSLESYTELEDTTTVNTYYKTDKLPKGTYSVIVSPCRENNEEFDFYSATIIITIE